MKICAFPATGSYSGPLYEALSKEDITVLDGVWSISWLFKHLRKDDVAHLHWPSFAYAGNGSKTRAVINFMKFCTCLVLLKCKGARIWWTAHNLLPHDRCELPSLDIIVRHIIIFFCECIFTHGKYAAEQLEKRFPATKSKNIQIPHGNWIDHYGPVANKHEAKTQLSIPEDKFVLLVFGQLRAYKNIHRLINLIQNEQQHDVYLLIAGRFNSDAYKDSITELLNTEQQNIRLDAKFIPNEDVPLYLAASDIMVMPYSEILTSGTAVLAISYGLPIMSVQAGFLNDVITAQTGVFIKDTSDKSINAAILTAKQKSWTTDEIINHAENFTFTEAAKTMANAFRQIKRN